MIRCFWWVRHVPVSRASAPAVAHDHGRRVFRPWRHRRPILRWTCIAGRALPLVAIPTIVWAWGGLPTGWGVAIPAVARGAANVTAVPEPSSLALLVPALVLAVLVKWRSAR